MRIVKMRRWLCARICGADHERALGEERQQRLVRLREEIVANQAIVSSPSLAGGLVHKRFQVFAWETAMADMDVYPQGIRDTLRAAYQKMRECNQLVEDFEQRRDGRVINTRDAQLSKIGPLLARLQSELGGLTLTM